MESLHEEMLRNKKIYEAQILKAKEEKFRKDAEAQFSKKRYEKEKKNTQVLHLIVIPVSVVVSIILYINSSEHDIGNHFLLILSIIICPITIALLFFRDQLYEFAPFICPALGIILGVYAAYSTYAIEAASSPGTTLTNASGLVLNSVVWSFILGIIGFFIGRAINND